MPLASLKVDSGVKYWASLIDGGLADETVHALILSYGVAPGGSSTDYVTGLYRAIFGLCLDRDRRGLLRRADRSGGSRLDVAQTLLGSFEASRTEIARLYQVELGWAIPLAVLKIDDGVVYWAGFIGGW